jgi:hypothetical protein
MWCFYTALQVVRPIAPCAAIARLPAGEIARLSSALPYLRTAELIGLLLDRVGAGVLEVLAPERQLQVCSKSWTTNTLVPTAQDARQQDESEVRSF